MIRRQRAWAASTSLKAIARPVAREPAPLVTRVLGRTVAKVDSIGLVVCRWMWCSGRVVEEGEQGFELVGHPGDGLGPGREARGEAGHRIEGDGSRVGGVDGHEGRLRVGLAALGQGVEDVRALVDPTPTSA